MITYQRQDQGVIAAPFEAILGPERVRFDELTRRRYARTTGLQCIMPAGVLYPQTTQEVVKIVRAAIQLKVALYPISCGKNWGYGDACATSEGQLILDFHRTYSELTPAHGFFRLNPYSALLAALILRGSIGLSSAARADQAPG